MAQRWPFNNELQARVLDGAEAITLRLADLLEAGHGTCLTATARPGQGKGYQGGGRRDRDVG